jgi:hypothetical protein
LDVVSVFAFNGCQAGVEQFAFGDDDNVKTRRDLVTTEDLSNESLSSISLYGSAETLRRGDPKPSDRQAGRQDKQRGEAAMGAETLGIHLLKFGSSSNSFPRPEAGHAEPTCPALAESIRC